MVELMYSSQLGNTPMTANFNKNSQKKELILQTVVLLLMANIFNLLMDHPSPGMVK
jgi:hypothetical protein